MLRSHLINIFLIVLAALALIYGAIYTHEKLYSYLVAIQIILGLYLIYAFFTSAIKSYKEWRYQPSRLR
ncbi:MAG TPA: hypothetical protein ENH28_03085 [Euryarchaeota archaeon]|nr:hypothetical protein BMS3Bbin15_00977 [archaeon BMS3Bbin15]HDL15126.1 hypothetical protein [Euryarchaeota archaeon]